MANKASYTDRFGNVVHVGDLVLYNQSHNFFYLSKVVSISSSAVSIDVSFNNGVYSYKTQPEHAIAISPSLLRIIQGFVGGCTYCFEHGLIHFVPTPSLSREIAELAERTKDLPSETSEAVENVGDSRKTLFNSVVEEFSAIDDEELPWTRARAKPKPRADDDEDGKETYTCFQDWFYELSASKQLVLAKVVGLYFDGGNNYAFTLQRCIESCILVDSDQSRKIVFPVERAMINRTATVSVRYAIAAGQALLVLSQDHPSNSVRKMAGRAYNELIALFAVK